MEVGNFEQRRETFTSVRVKVPTAGGRVIRCNANEEEAEDTS